MVDHAIIFDVDGVLLDLTRDEEELFFIALSKFVPTEHLSRDWNAYKIRNDEDIITEILEQARLPRELTSKVIAHYISTFQSATLRPVAISGAKYLLSSLKQKAHLGIATANIGAVAKHRLQQAKLWQPVADFAFGADGGGHKIEILGRALSTINLPPHRIVYIGDNINDVEAGLHHGVHFVGFSMLESRRQILRDKGAQHISENHTKTTSILTKLLT